LPMKTPQNLAEVTQMFHVALRKSEQKYRIIADNSFDWEFWLNPEGICLYTSPSCERITGYGADRYSDDPTLMFKIVHPDDRSNFNAHMKQVHETVPGKLEFRIIHADGDIRWIDHVCQPIHDENGIFLGRRGSNRDITDRKLEEENLRQREERCWGIIERIEDGYNEVDLAGNFKFFNPSFCRIMGYTEDELTGRNYRQYMDDDNAQKAFGAFNSVFKDRKPLERIAWEIIRKDGARRQIEVSVILTENLWGQATGFRSIVRDTTDRKNMEEALKKSEKNYRDIFENTVEGIFQSTPEGRFINVNPALARKLGFVSPEDMINSINDIGQQFYVNPQDRENLLKLVAEKDVVENYELSIFRKDRGIIWISVCLRAVRGADGGILYLEGTTMDITEGKQAQEELQRLNNELEQRVEKRVAELDEANAALKVLLQARISERLDIENEMLANLKVLVFPRLKRLRSINIDPEAQSLVDILESNISQIVSPFVNKLQIRYSSLTASEIQVAQFIREGTKTKDIAKIMNISTKTVDIFRYNIRKKLRLNNTKANLRSYLISL
jgi:two-component system, sensor histidine kinase and response regulator